MTAHRIRSGTIAWVSFSIGRGIVHDVITSRAMRTWLCWLALATGVAGCTRDKPAPPGPSTGGSAAGASGSTSGSTSLGRGSGAGVAPPAQAALERRSREDQDDRRERGALQLFVNDAAVATVSPAQVAGWPRLDALVPGDARRLGTWEMVALQGAGARP